MSAPLAPLLSRVATAPELGELRATGGAPVAVAEAARPFVLAALARAGGAPVICCCTPTAAETERLVHDLAQFLPTDQVVALPAWETLPFERVSPGIETMGARLEALWRIQQHLGSDSNESLIVVAPVRALLQRLASARVPAPLQIRRGDEIGVEALVDALVTMGYRREYQVEHRGEVAVRGGIVDVYPSTMDVGVRIDCFGDEVDRLGTFDVVDQRSTAELDAVELFGCRELLVDGETMRRAAELGPALGFAQDRFAQVARGESFEGIESFLPWLAPDVHLATDLLDERCRVVLVDPRRVRERANEILDEEAALASSLATTWGAPALEEDGDALRLHAGIGRLLAQTQARESTILPVAAGPDTPTLPVTTWPVSLGDLAGVARRLGELERAGVAVVCCADGAGSAERLADGLRSEGLEVTVAEDTAEMLARGGVRVVVAPIDRGFVLARDDVAILAEADLTGRRRPHRVPRARARPVEGFFDDLQTGSFVVHHVHGVARFSGMVTRTIGGAERDYLLLEYRGGDKLYVPSDQIDAITPYTGGEQPSLSRLNGSEWQRQRSRVRHAVREIAQELVVLYQRRLASPGYAFGPDTPWQAELEQSFPYPETTDQLKAIADVKSDMERPVPMDRLVCGDVGFGKTEVALRAVFKAVQDGKQAAVLVPTTLLAQQHFQTFAERFSPYPVRVEMLSRFLSNAQARAVVEGLRTGAVDVVIGTHALLAQSVEFSRLGLLVVDEEQRFGVEHKEAVKKLAVGVDILTLTASPIPRTLEMGLTGIRDLSIIDTPPAARQPILTYVGEYDTHAVAEAVRRELLREGQVFYVHNRVRDIEHTRDELHALVPEARLAIAHGQMDEATLEGVVLDFSEGRYDVLVCTTIIESGIDMPTVNTLVVDRSDLLGLGQLHQLRGRVGRAGQRAYAYLFHPVDRVLSEQAYERLRTIGEYTELGSGFKIAMRDLEIRGAGNLLGTDQSGHIAAVGYDLYVRMVAEAVAELKGEEVPIPAEVKLELPLDAHLPSTYVEREDLRLEAYRRLATVRALAEVDDVAAEWVDRFGPPPAPAAALLRVARLRVECLQRGITEVSASQIRPGSSGLGRAGDMLCRLSPVVLRASAQVRLNRLYPGAITKEDPPQLIVAIPGKADLADALCDLVNQLLPIDEPVATSA
jgi:transcription-repair coupling factor (superfamily II helicase)